MVNRYKKPWYVWLSIFALAALCGDTSRRIKFFGRSFGDNFDLWNRATGHILKLFVLYIILPIILFGRIANFFAERAPEYSLMPEILMLILLLLLYLTCVYATYKHALWRELNIPHLLNRPRSSVDAGFVKDEDDESKK